MSFVCPKRFVLFRRYFLSFFIGVCFLLPFSTGLAVGTKIETKEEWEAAGHPMYYLVIERGAEPHNVNIEGEEAPVPWHRSAHQKFWNIFAVSPEKESKNLAQFRINVWYEGEEGPIRIEPPHLFVSGQVHDGIPSSLKEAFLAASVNYDLVRVMEDVFKPEAEVGAVASPPNPEEAYKEASRKFLGFTYITAARPHDTPEGVRVFDLPSDERAAKYLRQPAYGLFQNFARQFYDSEQIIRQFMMNGMLGSDSRNRRNLAEFQEEITKLEKAKNLLDTEIAGGIPSVRRQVETELMRHRQLAADMRVEWGTLFPAEEILASLRKQQGKADGEAVEVESLQEALISKLRALQRIGIEIATHGHMCYTCRGIYWYDLEQAHFLERGLFGALVNKAQEIFAENNQKLEEELGARATAAPPTKGKKKKDLSVFELLLRRMANRVDYPDPRSLFFPECEVSILVSSSRDIKKTDAFFNHAPIPPALKWWDPQRREGKGEFYYEEDKK